MAPGMLTYYTPTSKTPLVLHHLGAALENHYAEWTAVTSADDDSLRNVLSSLDCLQDLTTVQRARIKLPSQNDIFRLQAV
jgi:hypothetical protein